jgi:hypothetical protein
MSVPVVAYAATAVPATMDGAGVLFTDKRPLAVAALIDAILSDERMQDEIIAGQRAAVDRLRARDFDRTLLQLVEGVLSAPRAARPHVTADFWREFDEAQALEDIRLDRPSAYKALPWS